MEPTHYINFSGGVDSTYYLWRFLKENPDKKIVVHHCLFLKRRRELEKEATDNILKEFQKMGLTNFEYVETEFSRKGIKGKQYDIEMIYFLSGLQLKNEYPKVHTVFRSVCQEEVNSNTALKNYMQTGRSLIDFRHKHNRVAISMQLLKTASRRWFNVISPYLKPKKDMVLEMPRVVFDHVWYCRYPENGKMCGDCHACDRVKPALKELKW